MKKLDFKKNHEIAKLIKLAFLLHEKDIITFPKLPYCSGDIKLNEGKRYKNQEGKLIGGIYENLFFPNHDGEYLAELDVIREGASAPQGMHFQVSFGYRKYNNEIADFSFSEIFNNPKTGEYDHYWRSGKKRTFAEEVETFLDIFEFIGFNREDVRKVINHEMTARDAFINIAPEELKDVDAFSYNRRLYRFNGAIAVAGEFGCCDIDSLPWQILDKRYGHPKIDCGRKEVCTAGVRFNENNNQVGLINVNQDPDSIKYADIKNAIIDETIDASVVNITGTLLGEHKVINIKDISILSPSNILLAYIGPEEENIREVRIMSNAHNYETVKIGLENGADGVGLFRNEAFLDISPELASRLVDEINKESYTLESELLIKELYQEYYKQVLRMYMISGDKNITFRLSDINYFELVKKAGKTTEFRNKRGAESLILEGLYGILVSEIRAIIKAAKQNNKVAKIQIPYITGIYQVIEIKKTIQQVAKEEDYDQIELGAMIENLKSFVLAQNITELVDFISIGTNDLTESVLNKKRNPKNPDFHILHKEVKEYIERIVRRVKKTKNIPINICGEHTSYIENLPFFLSLNIDSITCLPAVVSSYLENIKQVKEKQNSKTT
jgi:hypothetical protein